MNNIKILIILCLMSLLVVGCQLPSYSNKKVEIYSEPNITEPINVTNSTSISPPEPELFIGKGKVNVFFLKNSESVLVYTPEKEIILIDTVDLPYLIKLSKLFNFSTIDVLILTNPYSSQKIVDLDFINLKFKPKIIYSNGLAELNDITYTRVMRDTLINDYIKLIINYDINGFKPVFDDNSIITLIIGENKKILLMSDNSDNFNSLTNADYIQYSKCLDLKSLISKYNYGMFLFWKMPCDDNVDFIDKIQIDYKLISDTYQIVI